MDPFSLYIYIALSTGIGSQFSYLLNKGLGLRYSLRHTRNVQMANRCYRPKHQPL